MFDRVLNMSMKFMWYYMFYVFLYVFFLENNSFTKVITDIVSAMYMSIQNDNYLEINFLSVRRYFSQIYLEKLSSKLIITSAK